LPLEIQTPYLDNNRLKTAVSWLNTKHCSPTKTEFLVSWSAEESCGDRADFQVTVSDCAALLDGLQFSCHYLVRVTKGHEVLLIGHAGNKVVRIDQISEIPQWEGGIRGAEDYGQGM
jgi:hypothetical protein